MSGMVNPATHGAVDARLSDDDAIFGIAQALIARIDDEPGEVEVVEVWIDPDD